MSRLTDEGEQRQLLLDIFNAEAAKGRTELDLPGIQRHPKMRRSGFWTFLFPTKMSVHATAFHLRNLVVSRELAYRQEGMRGYYRLNDRRQAPHAPEPNDLFPLSDLQPQALS